ncbi:hypothetical protein J6590_084243 [Homalodisca vitripennis]|nr:hypothetical protein J6590_084243 [Homalodisca vitripennis]
MAGCMDGYDAIMNKRKRNQNDGVIVCVNKWFRVEYEEVSMHVATSIRVDMSVGGERLSFLAVYRSPSSDNDLDLFINDLEFYSSNRPRDRIHWLVGDVNCCILQENQRVGADLAGAVPPVAECVVDDDMHRVDSVFQLEPVTEQDIVKVVQDIRGGQIFLYADDTALLFEGSSWGEAYGAAEQGLRTVKRWFEQNQLTVNLHKNQVYGNITES